MDYGNETERNPSRSNRAKNTVITFQSGHSAVDCKRRQNPQEVWLAILAITLTANCFGHFPQTRTHRSVYKCAAFTHTPPICLTGVNNSRPCFYPTPNAVVTNGLCGTRLLFRTGSVTFRQIQVDRPAARTRALARSAPHRSKGRDSAVNLCYFPVTRKTKPNLPPHRPKDWT